MLDVFWFQTALCIAERILRKQLSRKILKALKPRKAHNFTPEETCLEDFVWYIHGHDKLKQYGFSIHGWIDGFSRQMLWLEVSTSNKMPEILAKYYFDALKQYGIPLNVRVDDGTEQSLVQSI